MDLGVQLYLAGAIAAQTYKDRNGATITLADPANKLIKTAYVAGPVFNCGLPSQIKLHLIMRFDAATSITLKLEESWIDANNPTLWPNPPTLWEILQLSAQDSAKGWTGTTLTPDVFMDGNELTFTPAAVPAGPGHLAVITTAIRAGGVQQLSAKAAGGTLTANDYIIARVNA